MPADKRLRFTLFLLSLICIRLSQMVESYIGLMVFNIRVFILLEILSKSVNSNICKFEGIFCILRAIPIQIVKFLLYNSKTKASLNVNVLFSSGIF